MTNPRPHPPPTVHHYTMFKRYVKKSLCPDKQWQQGKPAWGCNTTPATHLLSQEHQATSPCLREGFLYRTQSASYPLLHYPEATLLKWLHKKEKNYICFPACATANDLHIWEQPWFLSISINKNIKCLHLRKIITIRRKNSSTSYT